MSLYSARIVRKVSGVPEIDFEVPGGSGKAALRVLVHPVESEPWLGVFGTRDTFKLTELVTWEEGPMFLAVVRGYPHFVSALDPLHRVESPVFPVRHLLRHESGVVVVGDLVRMCGLDGNGVLWVSPTLADDWIEGVQMIGETVEGRGSQNAIGSWASFRISVLDGTTETEWTRNPTEASTPFRSPGAQD
jgi:hypothetical protein